jgi:transcription antitermination protein NusB
MPLPQKKLREVVFQILYAKDLIELDAEATIPLIMKQVSITKKSVRTAIERTEMINQHLTDIDALIGTASESYDFARIQRVELTVLRIGIFEMLYDETIPHKVAIAEALRITQKFSTKEAVHFVNAILDAIYKKQQGLAPDSQALQDSVEELSSAEELLQDIVIEPSPHDEEKEDPLQDFILEPSPHDEEKEEPLKDITIEPSPSDTNEDDATAS